MTTRKPAAHDPFARRFTIRAPDVLIERVDQHARSRMTTAERVGAPGAARQTGRRGRGAAPAAGVEDETPRAGASVSKQTKPPASKQSAADAERVVAELAEKRRRGIERALVGRWRRCASAAI